MELATSTVQGCHEILGVYLCICLVLMCSKQFLCKPVCFCCSDLIIMLSLRSRTYSAISTLHIHLLPLCPFFPFLFPFCPFLPSVCFLELGSKSRLTLCVKQWDFPEICGWIFVAFWEGLVLVHGTID